MMRARCYQSVANMDQDSAIASDAGLSHFGLKDTLAGHRFYGIAPDFLDEHSSLLFFSSVVGTLASGIGLLIRWCILLDLPEIGESRGIAAEAPGAALDFLDKDPGVERSPPTYGITAAVMSWIISAAWSFVSSLSNTLFVMRGTVRSSWGKEQA